MGSWGIETCICSILAISSGPLDGPEGRFGSTDPTGMIELDRRKAWEDVNAILRRFDRFKFSTRCILEDGKTYLNLDIVSNGELM
jgi:hypothetical protein